MIDRDIAYVSPSTVLRVLQKADLSNRWTRTPGLKSRGFVQPERVNEQWHSDISYLNIKGSFVFLITVLDGYSRAILAWDICERMESFDVEMVLRRAREDWLSNEEQEPRLITDNGSQYLSRDFKYYLREVGMKHSRSAPAHPQSNGKIERFPWDSQKRTFS